MSSTPPPSYSCPISILSGVQRWDIYHRLQELGISCECSSHKPLQVNLHSPMQVILFWEVVKHSTATRQELTQWLRQCWQQS